MKIDKPSHLDFLYVANRMRDRDLEELQAVYPVDGREAVAAWFVKSHAGRRDAFCCYIGAEPVAVGMAIEGRPNVITLGLIATDRFPMVAKEGARFLRQRFFANMKKAGCHRIECVTIEGYEETHRWLRILGLKREAIHPGYGKRGETFHTYAWIGNNVRPSGHQR